MVRSIQRHYPGRALIRFESALRNMRVMVDADGKPSACHLNDVTLADNFNDTPCDIIMDEARFEPARDSAGNPLASYFVTALRYRIFGP